MSKHRSNVHPDHYKTAGREPQGRDVVQSINRQAYATAKSKEKENFFRTMDESREVPEAGTQEGFRPGPQPVKAKPGAATRGTQARNGKRNGSLGAAGLARRSSTGNPHPHRFTIGDQDAVDTLVRKLRRSGAKQPKPEKLRKALEAASQEFHSTDAAERKAFFHGLLTGYSVGAKLSSGVQ